MKLVILTDVFYLKSFELGLFHISQGKYSQFYSCVKLGGILIPVIEHADISIETVLLHAVNFANGKK